MSDSASARVVNVSSDGHTVAKLDFDDLQAKRFYRALDIYVRVKLMNLLFTYELDRRIAGTGVTVNAVDPGGAHTQLTDSTTSDMLPPMLRLLYPLISRFTFTSVEKAAESSIFATAAPELEGISGKYIGTKLTEAKSSKTSQDVQIASRLWRISEELIGIHAGEKLAS
jgi:NAD(P)-dependent dehydrogenase (short-subunit alcohol dehydrogenase family)